MSKQRWADPVSAMNELEELHLEWVETAGEDIVSVADNLESVRHLISEGGDDAVDEWTVVPGNYRDALRDYVRQFPMGTPSCDDTGKPH